MLHFFVDWRNILWSAGLAAGAVVVAVAAHRVPFAVGKRVDRSKGAAFYALLARHEQRPTGFLLPVLALLLVVPWLPLPSGVVAHLTHTLGLALIGCLAWQAVAMLDVLQDYISHRHALELSDNLAARRVR